MASSLIKINEATALELQALPMIGPKRAERIVRYREEVSRITSEQDLATAAGLGIKQTRHLAHVVDWTVESEFTFRRLFAPLAIFLVSLAMIVYGTHEISLGVQGPVGSLYNASIILVLVACLSAITGLLGNELRLGATLQRQTMVISVAAFSAGFLLLFALVLFDLMVERYGSHILQTLKFVIFTALVIFLLYGPGLYFRFIGKGNDAVRRLERGARTFDLVQLPLAWAALILAMLKNTPSLIEEIFCLWAGVLFVTNSLELVRGHSSWLATLSANERAGVYFLAREEGHDEIRLESPLHRLTGAVLMLTGFILPVIAITNLVN